MQPEKIDPSTVAVTNEHPCGWWPYPYHERYRIMVDFDFDGHDDMLLSEPRAGVQFCLRVTAEGDNTLSFTGAEAFEAADADSLLPPSDGQTGIYRFTETIGDRLYVERKEVGYADC